MANRLPEKHLEKIWESDESKQPFLLKVVNRKVDVKGQFVINHN